MELVNQLLLVMSTHQVAGREWPSRKGVLDFRGSADPSNCPIIRFFSERVYMFQFRSRRAGNFPWC